jgi:prenyltransferase beta subunit
MKLIVASALAIVAALAASGLVLARTPSEQAAIDTTVRFLQESQRSGGGFAPPGGEPGQGTTAWVALALAAAGINPQDQARCGTDVYTYLATHFDQGLEEELAWPEAATTSFERELLVVDAAGTDPHAFAGYDLVAEITDRQLADGAFPYTLGGVGEVNDTIFAILALSPLHDPAIAADIDLAAEWLVAQQNEGGSEDGGFYFSGRTGESEVDMTGAALEALVAAGPPPAGPALAAYEAARDRALAYLHRAQRPDGGFPALPGREAESNVASTAWAVQGIWAAGGDPEAWTAGPEGRDPLGFMESMQQPDGHIRWRANSDLNGIWMTAYVSPAFAGQALPVPAAALGSAGASRGEAADCLESGQGGEAPRPGDGVLAGGGGDGAPAFSRPKRQSKGRTPGGVRVVHDGGARPRDHSATRRGENVRQPRGTQRGEAAAADEAKAAASGGAAAGANAAGSEGPDAAAAQDGGDETGGGAERTAVPADSRAIADAGSPIPASETAEVSGTVIGASAGSSQGGGPLVPGAPGLRSAGAGSGEEDSLALGIGVAALVAALGGAIGQRRREGARA